MDLGSNPKTNGIMLLSSSSTWQFHASKQQVTRVQLPEWGGSTGKGVQGWGCLCTPSQTSPATEACLHSVSLQHLRHCWSLTTSTPSPSARTASWNSKMFPLDFLQFIFLRAANLISLQRKTGSCQSPALEIMAASRCT